MTTQQERTKPSVVRTSQPEKPARTIGLPEDYEQGSRRFKHWLSLRWVRSALLTSSSPRDDMAAMLNLVKIQSRSRLYFMFGD